MYTIFKMGCQFFIILTDMQRKKLGLLFIQHEMKIME